MAAIEECEQALHELARRLGQSDATTRGTASFERTLACRLRDPDVNFAGRLNGGSLTDIHRAEQAEAAAASIILSMSGDDLLELVSGELAMAHAWATGRVRIDAGVLDLLRLRTLF
jgi:hypothetical protein